MSQARVSTREQSNLANQSKRKQAKIKKAGNEHKPRYRRYTGKNTGRHTRKNIRKNSRRKGLE